MTELDSKAHDLQVKLEGHSKYTEYFIAVNGTSTDFKITQEDLAKVVKKYEKVLNPGWFSKHWKWFISTIIVLIIAYLKFFT
jgi:hypothetical protein